MSKPAPWYRYRAKVLRVIDGDTIRVRIDLGFYVSHELTIRLARIDAPERNTVDGLTTLRWLDDALAGADVVIETKKDRADRYGRFLGEVFDGGEQSVNQRMLDAFLVSPWPKPVKIP
jgi:micrococcal nuclease